MNKQMIAITIRPNNTGKLPHLQSKQKKRSAQLLYKKHDANIDVQAKEQYHTNAIQIKHKMNNLVKYTTQEHTGYVKGAPQLYKVSPA